MCLCRSRFVTRCGSSSIAPSHLHSAETGLADFISAESSGEGQRLFRVSADGKRILDFFDIVADADGSNISDERVFRNISPADDGLLHLSFSSIRSTATLSGIDVLPVSPGKIRPIRIRAGWPLRGRIPPDSSGGPIPISWEEYVGPHDKSSSREQLT